MVGLKERERLKAGHTMRSWYLWNWEIEGFEAVLVVPPGDQLSTQSWSGTLGLKRQRPAMYMCLCGYRGDLHNTCPRHLTSLSASQSVQ